MVETQLERFGMSTDENHFNSALWGVLTFFPASSNKWKDTCRRCLLWDHANGHCTEACESARCAENERTDRKAGYFSIHQIPKNEKK